jgi:glutamyl-Q tRNA(Asp) synthetase
MARYRGRFAPSPTGPLHFGSLVAAAGSYLDARSRGGAWLVRIDDLDPPRVVPGAADEILRTLAACGMDWDEAVVCQSARHEAYRHAVERLQQDGLVYPCSCSRREIADSALPGLEGFVYPGTCRAGIREGRAAPHALRVRTDGARIVFDDEVQGRVVQDLERDSGDFVLRRADGVYAYQLAAAVDDAGQGITHVVRGADLLASTPRQIHLQRLLGLPTPHYAHLPVAVNAQGEKLSKQTHAAPVERAGVLPALSAALAFLGHPPPADVAAAGVRGLWRWAIGSWKLERVPRIAVLPAGQETSHPREGGDPLLR